MRLWLTAEGEAALGWEVARASKPQLCETYLCSPEPLYTAPGLPLSSHNELQPHDLVGRTEPPLLSEFPVAVMSPRQSFSGCWEPVEIRGSVLSGI